MFCFQGICCSCGCEKIGSSSLVYTYSCKCVDLESLCVAREKLCWSLYVDVVCLCDDGNVYDAVFLAASAALKNSEPSPSLYIYSLTLIFRQPSVGYVCCVCTATLPSVDVSASSPEVSCEKKIPLTLSLLPVAVSCGLFQRLV